MFHQNNQCFVSHVVFGQTAIVMVSNIILLLGGSLCVNLSHNVSNKVLFMGIKCWKKLKNFSPYYYLNFSYTPI